MLQNLKIANSDFSVVNVPNTGALVLNENKRRFYATIQNVSNTDIWILFSSQGAVGQGLLLPANGFSYEIDRLNLWQGAIYAIHGGVGNKAVNVLDCY